MTERHIISGMAAVIAIDNLDTDQIMPKKLSVNSKLSSRAALCAALGRGDDSQTS
jgi:3-isopropylmalate dehydratase small subunit